MTQKTKQSELKRNFQAFTEALPSLLPTHEGKYALMRHGTVVECFDSPSEALKIARKKFPDDLFSVQTVTNTQADFGWYSSAPNSRSI